MSTCDTKDTMFGVVLTEYGDVDTLHYRQDIPIPKLSDDEVLIRVSAAGINNTDINTRIGWYSKSVHSDTNTQIDKANAQSNITDLSDASWSGVPLSFPRIQGADACGHIVAVGKNVDKSRISERVIVRNMPTYYCDEKPYQCWTYGSDCDGAFAQYTKAPSIETYTMDCDWSDAELASVPCAYSTAEGMIQRANITKNDTVLVTGASGGVGSACVQLCKMRGATVIAITSPPKQKFVKELGADKTIFRGDDLVTKLNNNSVDVALDLVAGDSFEQVLNVLKIGGRYATSGAIAGAIVSLDVRTLYLKDLSFFGCTYQPRKIFDDLVSYINTGKLKPVVSKIYPLKDIAIAQQDFINKKYFGKIVLDVSGKNIK